MLHSHICSSLFLFSFYSLSILSPSQLHNKTHQRTHDLWTATLWARLKIYWTRLCLRWYKSYTPLCPLPPVLPFPWNSPPIISSKALASCPTLSFRPQDLLHGMENQVPQNDQSRSLIRLHLIPTPSGHLHSDNSHRIGLSVIAPDCTGRKNHPLSGPTR